MNVTRWETAHKKRVNENRQEIDLLFDGSIVLDIQEALSLLLDTRGAAFPGSLTCGK